MLRVLIPAAILVALSTSAMAQLRGHGGPVRAIVLSPDASELVSGSFDHSVIRWSLNAGSAAQVLRFHEGAINAVALLPHDVAATASEDGRIALWQRGEIKPFRVLVGHEAPVVALAIAPDGTAIASASWDRTVRVWRLSDGKPTVLEGHTQNVNGVAFLPSAKVVSVGHDAAVRIWSLSESAPETVTLDTPLNAVATALDGEIVTAGGNGKVYILGADRAVRKQVEVSPSPIIALALSHDEKFVAAASIRGAVAIIDRASGDIVRTLIGPGLPVWSLAFAPDGRVLYTGGADRLIRRWNAETGEPIGDVTMASGTDPLAAYAGESGAEVYRACVACHALTRDEGTRAGPSLHGIFGRRIATLPGYDFSPSLRQMDIVWSKETVAKLFEVGPSVYTPGTKMPEQRITSADDRAALVNFLEKATR